MPEEIDVQAFVKFEIPPKPGATIAVVFTWDGDFRSYFPHDHPNGYSNDPDPEGHTVEWYTAEVTKFLRFSNEADFLKLPQKQHRGWFVYLPYNYLLNRLKHIHQQWTDSPLAQEDRRGEQILIPVGGFPMHGPGKRGR